MGNHDDQSVTTLNQAVAATLRAERAVAQLTVRVLAERAGVPERTLVRLLNAERDINVNQVIKIATALGLRGSYILLESERRLAAAVADPMSPVDTATLDQMVDGADRKPRKTTQRNKRSGSSGPLG